MFFTNNNNNSTNAIEPLELLQIFNTYLNPKQTLTDDILKESEKQDIDVYFDQIIKILRSNEEKPSIIESKIK